MWIKTIVVVFLNPGEFFQALLRWDLCEIAQVQQVAIKTAILLSYLQLADGLSEISRRVRIPWTVDALVQWCNEGVCTKVLCDSSPLPPVAVTALNGSNGEEEGSLTWCIVVPAELTTPPCSGYTSALVSPLGGSDDMLRGPATFGRSDPVHCLLIWLPA